MASSNGARLPGNTAPDLTQPSKPVRNRDWSSVIIALFVGMIGLAIGRMGQLWIRFDVFSQFSLQFIFLIVAATLGLLSPRYKGLVCSIFFVLFLALYGTWPHIAQAGNADTLYPGEKPLRVAQFNSHSDNGKPDEIVAMIEALDPDVMTLVEFVPNQQIVLDKLKPRYPHQVVCWDGNLCQFAIISKTPLSAVSGQGAWVGAPYMQASLGAEYGNLTVVAVHTNRFPYANAQFRQVQGLVKHLETVPGRILVMGDFNATPFSRVIHTLTSSLGLTRQTSLPTWPSRFGFPQLAIDHIFTSEGIRAIDRQRSGSAAGSDHYPVMISLAVPVP